MELFFLLSEVKPAQYSLVLDQVELQKLSKFVLWHYNERENTSKIYLVINYVQKRIKLKCSWIKAQVMI